jgi:hypothetical protein
MKRYLLSNLFGALVLSGLSLFYPQEFPWAGMLLFLNILVLIVWVWMFFDKEKP